MPRFRVQTQLHVVQSTRACAFSLVKGTQGRGGFQRVESSGCCRCGHRAGLCSFAHPSYLPSSPETNKFVISIGDAELWRPCLRRHWSCGGCDNCQATSRADPWLSVIMHTTLTPAAATKRVGNCSCLPLAFGELGGAGSPGGGVWGSMFYRMLAGEGASAGY